jgi:hypothetical protein
MTSSSNGCSSSSATNFGRWAWVTIKLDDSQTATFPDSSGNHATITGLTLYYHPASNGRLHGGATFSNGSLQSLDAPPTVNLPISVVGPESYEEDSTLSLTNNAAGDILAGVCWGSSSNETITVSGGGVNTWNYLPAYTGIDSGFTNTQRLFWGVISSTGSQTLTQSGATGTQECIVQEFTAGTAVNWVADGIGGTSSSTGTTVNFPSLTPFGTRELYVGFAIVNGAGTVGSTNGFSYYITTLGNIFVYSTNAPSPSAPATTQNANGSDTAAFLIRAYH